MEDHRPRVLILERELQATALEAAVVSRAGYASEIAANVPQAIDALEADPPDVLLLGSPAESDAGLFVYDLLDTRLRRIAPRTIVLTTCIAGCGLLVRAASAGVFAVISRPFDVETLADVLAKCVRNDGRPAQVMWIGVRPATMIEAVDPTRKPVPETVH